MTSAKNKFDPITLEILWKRLISIVDEADASVIRTAFSSLLRDAHDYTCMFTDSRGQELVQGTLCTPGMAGAMALGMKKIVTSIPMEDYNEGDVFIVNDPWLLAGHLNDVCVWSPVFFTKKVVAFTSCIFHHTDIGGRTASDNRDIYAEGLYIPLTKLYDAGRLNKNIINIIRWNVRTPTEFDGDIRSQVAANHVCSQKIIEMMEDEGLDTLDDLADEIIDRTEKSMGSAIEKINNGTYAHKGIIEGAGNKPDIPIKLTVKVDGSKIHVDFDGTSKQVNWGVNVVYNFTYAYVFMAIKSAFNPGVPINEGAIRPITMTAQKGSIVNCTFPAAVAARMVVGHFMTEMVFNALAKAAPDNIIAGSGGTPAQTNIFHGSFANGKPWHTMIIRGGGMGASSKYDGHHCAIFPANGANTPVEILESDTSMIVESRSLIKDSGGPGKQRGGIGREMTIRSPEADTKADMKGDTKTGTKGDTKNSVGTISIAVQAGRYIYPPDGIFGGKHGSKAKFLKNGKNADPGGLTFCDPGDKISFISAGGGGYGDPFERDIKAVERDVQYGYISIEKAKTDYGVVIDPDSLKPDITATQKLRESRLTK